MENNAVPTDQPADGRFARGRHRTRVRRLVLAVPMTCFLGILALSASALSQPQREVAEKECDGNCGFSSGGSADFHAFDQTDSGVLHVLYLEARWTEPKLQSLRDHADGWRQTVTMRLPHDHSSVLLEHSDSDVPAARVELVATDPGSVTFTVTTRALHELQPGTLYRTQVLVRSRQDLDGTTWYYREQIDRGLEGGPGARFRVDQSSGTRAGVSGWCSGCYVVWDVDRPESATGDIR